MQLFSEIKNLFDKGTERKAQQQPDSPLDSLSWPFTDGFAARLSLDRPNPPLRYNTESSFQAYQTHELIYSCIQKLADVMNDAELMVERQSKDGWAKVEGHALVSLFKRPNALETGRDFRRMMVQSEQATGIFYAQITRSAAGIPVELHPLNPVRLQLWPNTQTGNIAFYRYMRPDGKFFDIKPEDMLIRRRSDMVNRFFGLAPLAVALKSINSDIGLTDYVDAFFASDGTPSGILKILNATLSDVRKNAILSSWKKRFSRGGDNQKGIAVLDQDASFESIGSKLKELAIDQVSDRFESRICSVFGVPPILVGSWVGLKHTTARATAAAALRDFWDNKISGELASLREYLTWFLLPEFESVDDIKAEKVRVGWDISHVAFLQEDATAMHQRARENFKAGGWTLNEFREATGMPPDEINGSDYYVQPNNVIAITPQIRADEADKEPQPVPAQLQAGDPNADPNADNANSGKAAHDHIEKKTFDLNGLTLAREPRGVELVIDLKAIAADYQTEKEKAVQIAQRFRDDLINQAAVAIDKLDPNNVYTLTLSPNPEAQKRFSKVLKEAYSNGRQQVLAELNAQKTAKNIAGVLEFKDDSPEDQDFLDELVDSIISKIISEIQSRAINVYTSLRILLDYSVDKLKEMLKSESTKFVEDIAGNVVNAAFSTGREAEIENNLDEIDHCEYSAILDVNTCDPCEAADGQTGATPADLPDAPNPDCEGGPRCRCFIVGVIV